MEAVEIEIVNRQRLVPVDPSALARLARNVILGIGKSREISRAAGMAVAIVRSRQMRRLNRAYRSKDSDTDVLSFPAGRGHQAKNDPMDDCYLGDVVICADVALRQSSQAGLAIDREISELLIHGVLHLAGYDHELDNGEMSRLELKLRRRLLDSKVRPAARRRHG
jgi:probable rRNA maturation factor